MSLSELPVELIKHIFTYLPAKDILSFRLVAKEYSYILSEKELQKTKRLSRIEDLKVHLAVEYHNLDCFWLLIEYLHLVYDNILFSVKEMQDQFNLLSFKQIFYFLASYSFLEYDLKQKYIRSYIIIPKNILQAIILTGKKYYTDIYNHKIKIEEIDHKYIEIDKLFYYPDNKYYNTLQIITRRSYYTDIKILMLELINRYAMYQYTDGDREKKSDQEFFLLHSVDNMIRLIGIRKQLYMPSLESIEWILNMIEEEKYRIVINEK